VTLLGSNSTAIAPRVHAWSGRAALGPGWALFGGQAGDNHVHRHPALQLVVSDGVTVGAEVDGRYVEGDGLLIGPNVSHALRPGPVWLLYVERESVWGRQLAATCVAGVRLLSRAECVGLLQCWATPGTNDARVAALVDQVAAASAPPPTATGSAHRLREVIAQLPRHPSESWTLDGLARAAALSPSRFAHAFKAQTGMALRPYLRWLRLARALDAAQRGLSLTEAAHEAGFADGAHFSRTMRRHFGIAPGHILASLRAAESRS
jgi:AraC-like DNA-binding protein